MTVSEDGGAFLPGRAACFAPLSLLPKYPGG